MDIYSLISQRLWTRSSVDLTWGVAFTWVELFRAEDLAHPVCLLLDTRKRKISPTFFCQATQSEENLSFPSVTRKFTPPEIFPALPAFTEDHLTDPLQWNATPDSQLTGTFLAQKGEGAASALNLPGRAGLHSPGAMPSYSAQKAEEEQDVEVRLGCWEEPSACES